MNHRSRKTTKKKNSSRSAMKKKKNRDMVDRADGTNTTWVDTLRFRPVVISPVNSPASVEGGSSPSTPSSSSSSTMSLSVISWNVLAHAYCSRRSQVGLPEAYQKRVFMGRYRRDLVLRILKTQFANPSNDDADGADVLCLQEVDMDEIRVELEKGGAYQCVETPRASGDNGATGSRVDSCSIFVRQDNWRLVEHELIRLDDLATLSSSSTSPSPSPPQSSGAEDGAEDGVDDGVDDGVEAEEGLSMATATQSAGSNNNLQGLQQSFLRRNVALLARIKHKATGETMVVANCHLYWNPGYEYVKLCQAHYVLVRARAFCRAHERFVLCGDLNSKPGGAVHTYLSTGSVGAKHYAPWYHFYNRDLERLEDSRQVENELGDDEGERGNGSSSVDPQNDESGLSDGMGAMGLSSNPSPTLLSPAPSAPRYMLDATLNKLCRWLRILGQDTALETDDEEKLRTGEGNMVVFERCRNEKRTLITTSTRLQCRSDCPPGTYVISPTFLVKLEVVLVHMLLTHGVVLEPESFLSRCVICNGGIEPVHDAADKLRILTEHAAPVDLLEDDLEVYQCDGCAQGYWWCDRPTSSASRIKGTATRLFQLCLRAGVPIHGPLSMMGDVDVEAERRQGWDYSQPGSDLLKQKLEVVEWLRTETLKCPFDLESAYARKSDDGKVLGEMLPFTNVTHDFVNTLDYVFSSGCTVSERLQIPTSLSDLNERSIEFGHLIPSDIWPSDHLPVGARLSWTKSGDPHLLDAEPTEVDAPELSCSVLGSGPPPPLLRPPAPVAPAIHSARCNCGCVPNVPSLFEMAELRRKARLAKP